jgi:cell division septation protein DedD
MLASAAAVGAVLLTGGFSSAVRAGGGAQGMQLSPGAVHTVEKAQARLATALSHLRTHSPPGTEGWKVQVGSFHRPQSAEAHLRRLVAKAPALAGFTPSTEPFGALTRARFGGPRDEAAARRLCARIVRQGSDCLAIRLGS